MEGALAEDCKDALWLCLSERVVVISELHKTTGSLKASQVPDVATLCSTFWDSMAARAAA